MDNKKFNKIVLSLLIAGVISIVILFIITVILYNQVSIITFIEKELW